MAIRFLTAGESHGKGLTVIIEGFPSGMDFDPAYLDLHLQRRKSGYGRGLRMKIESDQVEVLSGIRFGKTLGTPISVIMKNNDWANWKDRMDMFGTGEGIEKITIPRPGHADLTGLQKYGFDDIRNVIERASARETAMRVTAGTFARKLLVHFDIQILSFVEKIGNISSKKKLFYSLLRNDQTVLNDSSLWIDVENSSVRVPDKVQEAPIVKKIKEAKKHGNTLGGTFVVIAKGMPPGLGSYVHFDKRLDAQIAQAIMSIPAVKAVEIGDGFTSADKFGSQVHDEIIYKAGKISRRTNRSGGLEGGITTGLPLLVRGAMKPIATLMTPIKSIDLDKKAAVEARRERSDVTAVPACAVIAESMLAWVIASAFLEKFGGDSLSDIEGNYTNYLKRIEQL
jgi:chorismate synthase